MGGSLESRRDVMSFRAQRAGGFKVFSLPWDHVNTYDILRISDKTVWKDRLLHDRRTPPPDQAALRIDLSCFLAKQHDRTRTLLAMLAAGYRQVEVADHLGVAAPAITQRRNRAAREWAAFQGEDPDESSAENRSPSGGRPSMRRIGIGDPPPRGDS